uniref:Uncharacterized protein n=1 Tax=Arundo donax TaxID=35708 RepID=A0A0A8Y4K0_ARUDO
MWQRLGGGMVEEVYMEVTGNSYEEIWILEDKCC